MWSLWLYFKEANKGLFRNFLMNSFALILSVVCFLILAASTIVGINAKYIATNQENKLEVILHLKDVVTDYENIETKILSLPEVKEVKFITKEDAFEEMKQRLGDNQSMLTDLNFNPLPASFEITLKNPREMKKVVKILETWGVEKSIKYGQEYLDNYFSVTDRISNIAFWIIIVMSAATSAVIFASIRMNILNRNKEIEIKDLIGAGTLNIRIPFILEALILTTLSASLVIALVYFYYDAFLRILLKGLPIANFMSVTEILKSLAPTMYAVAICIGLVSSFLSTQKYLKRH